MAIEIAELLRIKGTIDAAIARVPANSASAASGLTETYLRIRQRCGELMAGTEAESEFADLFPEIPPAAPGANVRRAAEAGERAYLLLSQLSGWLGSWPSAEALLDEIVRALESAEAQAEEPNEKARLATLREGLVGAGRQIAVEVIAAYLSRQV